ncbi:UPF0548 protein At2g17695 isoform X1 [Populus trichocarpa]|uniref:UPF0548 protein At2g17695 isoform X1 n=1 Tax=Populus trichocarpa TaxID=3694 RepID=UPI000CCCF281|nr:UPF0548 protein At2g17695 isoform X1 [Populus trichocarpa]|eukprot:XP_024456698.1 UPF0548 protein At2g17695 isoform X1 [Populus trichocarpa]
MVFLCWAKPSLQEQKDCLNKSDGFNYDSKYRGATSKHASSLNELSKDGFLINHARVLVGSGVETYEKGKLALENWRHFGFDWGFVDSKTPIRSGVKFCVCVKEFLPWVMMPLQIVYVNESRSSKKDMASFCFGGGTLQGHLLAITNILLGNRLGKSVFQLKWMRRTKCGTRSFPSQSLPTFCHLSGTPMFNLGKSFLLISLAMLL